MNCPVGSQTSSEVDCLFEQTEGITAHIKFTVGGVAQLVRACGSYPQCPGFESLHRHHIFSPHHQLSGCHKITVAPWDCPPAGLPVILVLVSVNN